MDGWKRDGGEGEISDLCVSQKGVSQSSDDNFSSPISPFSSCLLALNAENRQAKGTCDREAETGKRLENVLEGQPAGGIIWALTMQGPPSSTNSGGAGPQGCGPLRQCLRQCLTPVSY